MEIVQVNRDNLIQAAEIHAISWRESHREFCSPAFVEEHTIERQADFLLGELHAGKKIFMLVDEKPVGIVSVDDNRIANLYVLPEEQKKGYGSILLEHAIRQCKGTPCLWVLSNNEVATRMYYKRGFRESGIRKYMSSAIFQFEMRLL